MKLDELEEKYKTFQTNVENEVLKYKNPLIRILISYFIFSLLAIIELPLVITRLFRKKEVKE